MRTRGWAINDGDFRLSSTNFAATITDQRRAVAAIILTAPAERLTSNRHKHYGGLVSQQ